jgi:hypothetical protein
MIEEGDHQITIGSNRRVYLWATRQSETFGFNGSRMFYLGACAAGCAAPVRV